MTWANDPICSSAVVLRRSLDRIGSAHLWAREMRETLERTMVLIAETSDLIRRSYEAEEALRKTGENCTGVSAPER